VQAGLDILKGRIIPDSGWHAKCSHFFEQCGEGKEREMFERPMDGRMTKMML
jgi:hypothetical protein